MRMGSTVFLVFTAALLATPLALRAAAQTPGQIRAPAFEHIAYATDTEGFPRLPSVFRNCEEPLPRYCVRPPGLLWFGSIETLQWERAAGRCRRRC
jgi:hypothetical protein